MINDAWILAEPEIWSFSVLLISEDDGLLWLVPAWNCGFLQCLQRRWTAVLGAVQKPNLHSHFLSCQANFPQCETQPTLSSSVDWSCWGGSLLLRSLSISWASWAPSEKYREARWRGRQRWPKWRRGWWCTSWPSWRCWCLVLNQCVAVALGLSRFGICGLRRIFHHLLLIAIASMSLLPQSVGCGCVSFHEWWVVVWFHRFHCESWIIVHDEMKGQIARGVEDIHFLLPWSMLVLALAATEAIHADAQLFREQMSRRRRLLSKWSLAQSLGNLFVQIHFAV